MACQITYKNKKYDYEGFMSLLAKGEFNSLVDNGSIDVSKLKGEYEDALPQRKTEKILQREQKEVGETRGERGRVEQGKQGEEIAEEGKEEEIKYSFIAWHGSPHEFDKFSTEKIGTGEGAQAFGWGLYFTELKGIAEYYADRLSRDTNYVLDGSKLPSQVAYDIAQKQATKTGVELLNAINNILKKNGFREIKQENELKLLKERNLYKTRLLKNKKGYSIAPLQSSDRKWNVYSNEIMDEINSLQNKQGILDNLKDYPPIKRFDTKEDATKWISENTEYNWIEWDKPITKDIKKKIEGLFQIYKKGNGNYDIKVNGKPLKLNIVSKRTVNDYLESILATGKNVYQDISDVLGGDKNASLYLLEHGIDGIKYPAESLSGKPTRGFNYVVFDENAVTIEEQIKFSLSDELTEVKSSLDNLVKEGVYTKGQVDGLLKKVEDNFNKLQEQGKPTSADVSFAYLMELIKLRSEKQREKKFRVLAKEISSLLKNLLDAKERKFINSRQYQSIINRISRANTDDKRQKILDYVNDTVIFGKGAKFKARLAEAKGWQDKIKENNKKEKSKFGSARPIADSVMNIDLGELTYEQLAEFSKTASKIFPVGKEVDIANLIMLNDAFGAYQKTKEEEEVDSIDTFEKLWEYIGKLSYIDIVDIPSYIQFRRMYNSMIKKYNVLLSSVSNEEERAELDEKWAKDIDKFLLEVEEATVEFKKELDEFKKKYTAELLSRMRSPYVRDGLEKIESETDREWANDFLNSDPRDISELTIEQLSALNTTLNNIAIGEVTKQFMELLREVNSLKYQRQGAVSGLQEAIDNKLWKETIEGNARTWIRRNLVPEFKWKGDLFQGLVRRFRSKQWFRWGNFVGNFSQTDQIGRISGEVGTGMNREQMDEFDFLNEAGKVYETKFAKGKTGKEQRMWLHRISMFMIENRWYSSRHSKKFPSFLYNLYVSQIDRVSTDNPKEFLQKVQEYKDFIDYLKAKDPESVKEVNGEMVFDIPKVEAIMRQESGVGEMIDFVRDTFGKYKDRHMTIGKYNDRSLLYEDNYFHFMRSGGKDDVDKLENMEAFLLKGVSNAKWLAGSTHEWTGQLMDLELDVMKVLLNHTKMVRRNFYVYPILREHTMAVQSAYRRLAKEEKNKGKFVDILGRAIIEATRSRVSSIYNLNNEKNSSKMFKFAEVGVKKGMLVKPDKFAAEMSTNLLRVSVALGKIPVKDFTEYWVNREDYSEIVRNWVSESMWSVYSPEVQYKAFGLFGKKFNTGSITNKIKQFGKWNEKISDWMLKTPDKSSGLILFVHYMNSKFKDITGEKFDINKFKSDEMYRIKFRDAIEKSQVFADTRVEELFNSKNPMSNAELNEFLGGIWTPEKGNIMGRIFGYLQSFGRNDSQQIIDSWRRYHYSNDEKIRAMAKRDMLAVITSNFSYGIIRRMTSVAIMAWVYNPLAMYIKGLFIQGGGDDDEKNKDEEYFDQQKELVFSGNFLWRYSLYKTAPDLLMGGSSNIYEYAGKLIMFAFETSEGIEPEVKDEVYKLFRIRYMDRIPATWADPEATILKATPPVVQPALTDALSFAHSLIEYDYGSIAEAFYLALIDGQAKGVLSKKDVFDIANIINMTLKYTAFSPVIPPIERRIKSELTPLRKEYLKQKRKEHKGEADTKKTTTVNY